jgi:monoterpene epsilon-lactone hydrolase
MASPQLKKLIAAFEARAATGSGEGTSDEEIVAQYRSGTEDELLLVDGIAPTLSPDSTFKPVTADGVPCEWVLAAGADTQKRLFFIHGGGWIAGSLDGYRHQIEALSRATGMAVLAVDYRLAPEHPFPAGLDDCVTAWMWMQDHGPEGEGACERALLAGDSAGGNLTFALLLRLKDEGKPLPVAAAAFAPATDFTGASPSMTERQHLDPFIRADGLAWIFGKYVQDGTPPTHPYVSPLYGDLSGLPPFLVHSGEREVLHDDGLRIVEAAKKAGVDARFKTLPGLIHTTEYWCHVVPEGLDSLNEVGAFLKSHG